ncbi:MAG TPA: Gfo/Idh/MocA family oxidoreductase [Opitutaceae bacterium]|nr:Gfo/Idh/MocA family oxidoreductase [Opitutaceae bacterium]
MRTRLTAPHSRRAFLREAAGLVAAAGAAPLLLPARLFGAEAPSGRIRVGQIGCGRIARGHDMPGVFRSGLADIVAVCDVDARRLAAGRELVEKFYRDDERAAPAVAAFGDYRELLARADLDAVVISLPDHWHAEVALAAVRRGKHVYLQKPFTMTYAEGALLERAVARSGCVMQIGSQQRSWGPDEQFRRACECVRSGRVGRLARVEIGLPTDPTAPDDPPQPVPEHLDYDQWLGPAAEAYYTEQRVHSQQRNARGELDIASRPGWLRNEAFCLGMITGWGSHHYDTALWGMDAERVAPLRIEGRGEFPQNTVWNVHGAYHVELAYPGGVRMTVTDRFPNGIRFVGDEGWIFVSRGPQPTTGTDMAGVPANLKPLDASDPRLLDPAGLAVQFAPSTSHHHDWLECVRDGKVPLAPAPVAHNANTACILSWIAMKLGRPLEWDARAGRFVNDAGADALLRRPERGRYGALKMA